MNQRLAFEAAEHATESLGPAGDPLAFVLAAALVLATALLLLLGGRVHRGTEDRLGRVDGIVAAREEPTGGPDA